jgi:hypothetical protein
MAMNAWIAAEPAGSHDHLILYLGQPQAEEKTELLMFQAAAGTRKADANTHSLIKTIKDTFAMHPEMNLVDDWMRKPLGYLLEPQDDLAAYANALARCADHVASRRIQQVGNHLVTPDYAQHLLQFSTVLAPYVKPFLMGNQAKLHEELGQATSDFARGCISRLIVP